MRKLVFGLALATSLVPSAGHAQVTLDMTQVTCANYLAMSPSQARVFSAWMSGWFNQRISFQTKTKTFCRRSVPTCSDLIV